MIYKTDESDSLSVYAAGAMCSLTAWLFPLLFLVDQMEYPWPARIGLWVVGMVVMGAGSWIGVGMAIGLVLMHVMGVMG